MSLEDFHTTSPHVFADLSSRPEVAAVELLDERQSIIRFKLRGSSEWRYVRNVMGDRVSSVARTICDNKSVANKIAAEVGMSVPNNQCFSELDDAAIAFMRAHEPVVVKPIDGAHGDGVTVGVRTIAQLKRAFKAAIGAHGSRVLLQVASAHPTDVRVLVIDGVVVAALERQPASVIGDGERTIAALIEHENTTNSKRTPASDTPLNPIAFDNAKRFLGNRGLAKIPHKDVHVQVVGTANMGAGGTTVDATDRIDDDIKSTCAAMARELRLSVCGIDLLWNEQSGDYDFIEINACPGLRLHEVPAVGTPRPVIGLLVDSLLASSIPKGGE